MSDILKSLEYACDIVQNPESSSTLATVAIDTIFSSMISSLRHESETLVLNSIMQRLNDLANAGTFNSHTHAGQITFIITIAKFLSNPHIENYDLVKIVEPILDLKYSYSYFFLSNLVRVSDGTAKQYYHQEPLLMNEKCFKQLLLSKFLLGSYPYITQDANGNEVTLGFSQKHVYIVFTLALRYYYESFSKYLDFLKYKPEQIELEKLFKLYNDFHYCVQKNFEINNKNTEYFRYAYIGYRKYYCWLDFVTKSNYFPGIATPTTESISVKMCTFLILGLEHNDKGLILCRLRDHYMVVDPEFNHGYTLKLPPLEPELLAKYVPIISQADIESDFSIKNTFMLDNSLFLTFMPLFRHKFTGIKADIRINYAKVYSYSFRLSVENSEAIQHEICTAANLEYKSCEVNLNKILAQTHPASQQLIYVMYTYAILHAIACAYQKHLKLNPSTLLEKKNQLVDIGTATDHAGFILYRLHEDHVAKTSGQFARELHNKIYNKFINKLINMDEVKRDLEIKELVAFDASLSGFFHEFTSEILRKSVIIIPDNETELSKDNDADLIAESNRIRLLREETLEKKRMQEKKDKSHQKQAQQLIVAIKAELDEEPNKRAEILNTNDDDIENLFIKFQHGRLKILSEHFFKIQVAPRRGISSDEINARKIVLTAYNQDREILLGYLARREQAIEVLEQAESAARGKLVQEYCKGANRTITYDPYSTSISKQGLDSIPSYLRYFKPII